MSDKAGGEKLKVEEKVKDDVEPQVIDPDTSDDDDDFVDALDREADEAANNAILDELSDSIDRKKKPGGKKEEEDFDDNFDQDEKEEEEDLAEKEEKEEEKEDLVKIRQEAEDRLSEEELGERRSRSLELKKEANQLYVSSQQEEAISIYSQALDICPLRFKEDRAILFANRAAAKLKMGDKEAALEDCNESVSQNPVYLKALVRRAQLFEELDKPHESMKDYQEVLKLDPRHIEATVAVASRLPEKIKEKDEKLKAEMMDNLKKLGNMVLNPFGLSTDNFNLVQDPNTGGYSVNFSK